MDLAEGTRVVHPYRGKGVVVKHDPNDPRDKMIVVEYDNGQSHHYSRVSAKKLSRDAGPAKAEYRGNLAHAIEKFTANLVERANTESIKRHKLLDHIESRTGAMLAKQRLQRLPEPAPAIPGDTSDLEEAEVGEDSSGLGPGQVSHVFVTQDVRMRFDAEGKLKLPPVDAVARRPRRKRFAASGLGQVLVAKS